MVRNFIAFILVVISTYPVCAFGEERAIYLEKRIEKAEMELKKIGYDTAKLKNNQLETPLSIFKPDCKMIYPYSYDLFNKKDFDGKYYIRKIVKKTMDSSDNFSQFKYRWQTEYDPAIKTILFVTKYIKEQNIIIAASENINYANPTIEYNTKADNLLRSYFTEVKEKGVDHETAVEAYKLLMDYIVSLPNQMKIGLIDDK